MAKVVFLGTPEFAVPVLECLYDTHEVVAVITQPDQAAGRGRTRLIQPPVKVWAAAHQLPVIQPPSLRRDVALYAHLRALAPDVLVLAAYGQILRQNILTLAPGGCIGVHASLLPRWRGAAPIAAAILNGDEITGVTLMHTDTGMDTGAIIAQRSMPIAPDDATPSLTNKLAHCGAALLKDTLPDWLAGKIIPQPQDESQVTWAPPLTRMQGKLDFSLSSSMLERQVRALNPWPGTWTLLDGLLLKVLKASSTVETPLQGEPGTVIMYDGQVGVIAGEGMLLFDQVQPANKRAMTAIEFARGHRGFIGARLG
ncbi:MAG: methionyl-tRNA formyltransferase [Chloroflexi bacterium]|nr:methionyl-tRNA formyltransferase [Chloroflexota bacterium]